MQVMGVVRKRDVVTHASRLDTDAYAAHINRNSSKDNQTLFVIGSDIIASTIARMLHDHGLNVKIVNTHTAENEASLDASQGGHFPSWLEERVSSMCERTDTSTVADIGVLFRQGVPKVDALPNDGFVVHDSQEKSKDFTGLALAISHRVWQTVEHIWNNNSVIKPKSASIQTKLI